VLRGGRQQQSGFWFATRAPVRIVVVADVEVILEAVVETTVELFVVVAAFEPHDVVIINKAAINPRVSP